MKIGILKETKVGEGRVALTPLDVKKVIAENHAVCAEKGAGTASGFSDAEYESAGAVVGSRGSVYEADLIVKVKEPSLLERDDVRKGQVIFCFLHLAAYPELAELFLKKNITAVAFETIEEKNGVKPILHPMSVIAGRLAALQGMQYLIQEKGLLISDAVVTVIGAAGIVGSSALAWLSALGAKRVNVADVNGKKLRAMRKYCRFKIVDLKQESIGNAVAESDLLVLAAAVHGASAPKIITRPMVASMRPGSALVDVAIDQGGCSETSLPTTLSSPIYWDEGVIHYCVPNMPGSVPGTSTPALSSAIIPRLLRLARCFDLNLRLNAEMFEEVNNDLYKGIQVYQGMITNQALAESLGKDFRQIELCK